MKTEDEEVDLVKIGQHYVSRRAAGLINKKVEANEIIITNLMDFASNA
jgi:hypothetical protein